MADLVDGRDFVLITRHGEHVAVVYPLRDPKSVPAEVRRRIYFDLTSSLAGQLGTEGEGRRPPLNDPVIESFKRDVDRTLIRENLRRTPEARLMALQSLQRFAEEARQAGPQHR